MVFNASVNIEKNKTLVFIGFFFIVILFIFNIWRCRYTFDGYDEVYYSALPYSFLLGKQPFGYMCSIHQLPMLFNVPFVWIWYELTDGSMAGIILFFRILYCTIVFAITAYLYRTLEKKSFFDIVASVLICGVFMVFTPFNLYSLSYNTIPYIMLLLGALLLYNGLNNKRAFIFFAGIAYAIAIQAYPMLIVSVFIPIIFIAFHINNRTRKQVLLAEITFFAGTITVLIALIGVICYFNGFENLWNTMTGENIHINTNPIAQGGNPIFVWVRNMWHSLDIRLIYLIMIFTLASMFMMYKQVGENRLVRKFFLLAWICILTILYIYIFVHFAEDPLMFSGCILLPCTMMFPSLFLINRCHHGKWMFLYLLGCIHSITILISSYNSSFAVSMYGLISSTVACLGLLKSTMGDYKPWLEKAGKAGIIVSMMMVLILFGYNKFLYLYGELEGFSSLSSQMQYGPAKGIITNKETCINYHGLYNDILETLDNKGDICFGNKLPIGYLCVGNKPNCRSVLSTNPTAGIEDIYYEEVGKYPQNVYFVKKELRGFRECAIDIETSWNTEFGNTLQSNEYQIIETKYFYIFTKVE